MPDKTQDLNPVLRKAIEAGAPWIYVNGFQSALTNADVLVICERTNQPVAVLNLSYTAAKTLAHALTGIINTLEEKAGREIMTVQDVDRLVMVNEE